MYTNFFGINEKPFSITPDPRYLFMSERHGEALAHLVYGVTESGGFIQLTGEVGTGKTTLCRTLLLNRMPSNADVAVVLNPQLSDDDFGESIRIGDEIQIVVKEIRRNHVRIGIMAPREIKIYREEVYLNILGEEQKRERQESDDA